MKNLFKLDNRVVVLTGGMGHLGRAMVCAVAEFGGTVVIPYYKPVSADDIPGEII